VRRFVPPSNPNPEFRIPDRIPNDREYFERRGLNVFVFSSQYNGMFFDEKTAGNEGVISWAVTNYHLHKAYPDLIGPEYVFRGLTYILGCHPASNVSFVSGVGTRSKMVAYGNNRADFAFIAGGVVPGVLVLKPDFPENKEDWPFLWGENEYVIDICANYIFLVNAVNDLMAKQRGAVVLSDHSPASGPARAPQR
jgi:hypothetical protein